MSNTTDAVESVVSDTLSETIAATTSIASETTSSTPNATSTSSSESGNSSVSIGAIAGLIIGALSLIALGAFFVILRRRYLRRLGITDSEAHLHEVTERTDRPRPTTIIEIRTGRRTRRPRSEPWVEPPPTYQEAHADGVVPAYEENETDSGSDRENNTAGSRSPLRTSRSPHSLRLGDFHLRSPISIRNLRIPRSPVRSPVRSPIRSPVRSPVRSPELSPVRQVNTAAEFDEEEARARQQV